jgi:DNA-binding CsgD family transcriptional regulator
VNQIIYKEFVWAKWEGRNDWAERASVRLERDHGISRTPGTIQSLLGQIKNGSRNGIAASDFTQGLSYDSIPSSRYEKDAMHARMEILIHEHLYGHRLHYIGLPANQIVSVARAYDTVVACEKDKQMTRFMFDMDRYINQSSRVRIYNEDVFDFLERTNKKFNVFEFDMMCALNSKMIKRMAQAVLRTALSPSLIVVVSIGGRHISTYEYEVLMPYVLIGHLEKSAEWSIINHPFSGRYKDIKIPMRYELLVISKDDDEVDYDPEYYEENEGEFVVDEEPVEQEESKPIASETVRKYVGTKSIDLKTRGGRILRFLKQYCPEYFSNVVKMRTRYANLTDKQFLVIESMADNISRISDELTEHQQRVFKLHLEGKSQLEIAAALDIHQTSVSKALHGNMDYDYDKKHGGIYKKILKSCRQDKRFMDLVSGL